LEVNSTLSIDAKFIIIKNGFFHFFSLEELAVYA